MDIKNMKMMIGIVVAIVAQAFGMIWYIAQLDSTVTNNTVALENIEQYCVFEHVCLNILHGLSSMA